MTRTLAEVQAALRRTLLEKPVVVHPSPVVVEERLDADEIRRRWMDEKTQG